MPRERNIPVRPRGQTFSCLPAPCHAASSPDVALAVSAPTGRFCVTRKPSMAWLLGDLGLPVRRQGSAGAWRCVTPRPRRRLPIAAGSWRQLGCGFHGAEHSWSCSCPARVTSHPHEERPRGGWSPAPAPSAELTPPGHVRLGLEWAPSSAPPAPRSLSSLAPSLPLKR